MTILVVTHLDGLQSAVHLSQANNLSDQGIWLGTEEKHH